MRNQIRTVLLLGVLSALLVGIGALVAPQYVSGFVVLALAMNLGAYFFSDKIVLAMHRAREVSPAEAPTLHRMVGEVAARAGVPKPRVYMIVDAQPNAFATGRNPRHGVVAVTAGILDLLDERELRGVLAHEIGHIKNRDILVATIAAAMGSLITYVSHAFGWFGGGRDEDGQGSPAAGFLLALVAPFAAMLIQLGISRSREHLADETGARLSGDPDALARALLKLEQAARVIPAGGRATPATASLFIVNPFAGAGHLLKLFSTHPPVQDRVRRLRALLV